MLKKEKLTTLNTGWLSPDGSFFPADYMEHIAVAEELYQMGHSECNKIASDVDDVLLIEGWCKIYCVTFLEHGFLVHFLNHLTAEQKAVIKPVYEVERERVIKSNRYDLDEELY